LPLVFLSTAHSQNFAPTDRYLVDSLDLASISGRDKILIDSVLTLYEGCINDTCRVQSVGAIVEASWDEQVWPRYNEWVLQFTRQSLERETDTVVRVVLEKAMAGALNNVGYLFNSKGQIEKALEFYQKSLEIQKRLDDKVGMAGSFINIGHVYHNQGLVEQALEYYYRSLELEEAINNQQGVAIALNGIGYIHYRQSETEKALDDYNRSLQLRKELGDEYGIATCLNNIGLLYKDKREWNKALDYYTKCLAIQEGIADESGVAISLSNIGIVHAQQGQHNQALEYYMKSLEIRERLEEKEGISDLLNSIAEAKLALGDLKEARRRGERSLKIAQEINYPVSMRNAASTMAEIARKEGNWEEAFKNYELFIQMRDSVQNEETTTAAIHRQYQYKYEKKALTDSIQNAELQLLKDVQLTASKSEAKWQQQQSYFLYIGLFLVLVFAAVIYNRLQIINKQKELIEKQKEEVESRQKMREKDIQRIEQHQRELEHLNEELNQFAYVVSHDLKTPLRGIAGVVTIIESDYPNLDKKVLELFALLKERSVKMHQLIEGVLDYSRAGSESVEMTTVDARELINEIIKEVSNDNAIRIKLSGEFPEVKANYFQLKQVFTNLIANAIKYNHRAANEGEVIVSAMSQDNFYQFEVADNGPGISKRDQSRIFELFRKAHAMEGIGSNGIGLSIVKKLVQQNGGVVSVDSEIGRGSVFKFTWPS